jgi:hypothetical protein
MLIITLGGGSELKLDDQNYLWVVKNDQKVPIGRCTEQNVESIKRCFDMLKPHFVK